jgi:2-polyprenyl-6-methoxyphenol hydroxylase-like FAD-dependent oxidoreductase
MHSFINVHFKSKELIERLKAQGKQSMLHFIFNPNLICVLITYDYTNGNFVLQVPCYSKSEDQQWKNRDYTGLIKAILSEKANIMDIEVIEVKQWRMRNVYANKWYDDNIFIIGDAAHQFPPSGGYGLNTGIVDAFSLAWRLYYLQGNGSEMNRILKDTFEKERIIHTKVTLIS